MKYLDNVFKDLYDLGTLDNVIKVLCISHSAMVENEKLCEGIWFVNCGWLHWADGFPRNWMRLINLSLSMTDVQKDDFKKW